MDRRFLIFTFLAMVVGVTAACSRAYAQLGHRNTPLVVDRLDEGIYFGAAPKSDADFAKLRRLGVRRIVDVRTFKVFASAIERRRAARYGIAYQRIPTGFLPTKTGTVPQIMTLLNNAGCGAVYFHCNLGSDRTGMIAAIYRTEQFGWDPQHAFAVWKSDQFNTKLKDLDRYYWQHVGSRTIRTR